MRPELFALEAVRPVALPRFAADEHGWERALEFATSLHAALPFAVRVRRAPWAPDLPAAVAARLEGLERRERMTLALIDQELEAALDALEGAGIPVVVLKGMDVGHRFYPERILRPMGDADVLVPGALYGEAWRALEHAGFSAIERRYAHSFRSSLARSRECPSIDLHFGLIETDSPARLERLWDRSRAAVIPGLRGAARALSAEDCFVYVLRHGAVLHVLESPIWLTDLHYLVSGSPGLDWDYVLRELRETRARAAGWFALDLLARHWNTRIPAEALGELARGAGALRRLVAERRGSLERWFPVEGRSRSWMLRSRFLLRENARDAATYWLARKRRKNAERSADLEAAAPANGT